jgi:D-sedoheptulose 7-phosphate isomerase
MSVHLVIRRAFGLRTTIENILKETALLHNSLVEKSDEIEELVLAITRTLKGGGTLYVMGNGGSAADAQHLAGELIGRFRLERRALPCVALSTDTSVITAIANDYSVEETFRRQVEALVTSKDAVLGISTSGNSANVLEGLKESRRKGALNLGLTGGDGGAMKDICDSIVCVDAEATARIQEAHQTIIHIICHLVEEELCST